MEEKICSICKKPIVGEEYEDLGNEDIACKSCAEKSCRKCDGCEQLFPNDELNEVDGKYYCEYCQEDMFGECDMCGSIVPEDDLHPWGDIRICSDCLEEECPSFDEEENIEETTEAYEAMLERYVGRKSEKYTARQVELSTGTSDSNVDYRITVMLDDDGIIEAVSRLSAEMLLCEGVKSSVRRPYAIDPDDYERVVDDLMEELELEEPEDEEDEE